MSTKLEDLSVSDYNEEDYQDYNPNLEELATIVEEEQEEKQEEKQEKNKEELQNKIYNFLYDKIKEPFLVTILGLLFTNKLFLQLINSISLFKIVEDNIGINVFLSILAGVIFFILREFV